MRNCIKMKKRQIAFRWAVGFSCMVSLVLLICQCGNHRIVDENATIALYSGRGADEECVRATKNMFGWMGHTVSLLDADYINEKRLDGFELLCVPGGNMYQYSQDISSEGKRKIRDFISSGKAYVGICGGAYFAAEKVFWQGDRLPMEPLGLFAGTAKGPYDEIAPFPDYGMPGGF
jgi:biotin--protein ligase